MEIGTCIGQLGLEGALEDPGASVSRHRSIRVLVISLETALVDCDDGTILLKEKRLKLTKDTHITPLQAAGYLAKKLKFEGCVTSFNGCNFTALLNVYLPKDYITGRLTLPKSPALTYLLLNIQPLHPTQTNGCFFIPSENHRLSTSTITTTTAAGTPLDTETGVNNNESNSYSVRNLLLSLPSKAEEPNPPPLLKADCTVEETTFADLNRDTIATFLARLKDPETVQALSATCRHFRVITSDLAPGLTLALFPHQRAAVRWMLLREGFDTASPSSSNARENTIPHPTIREFRSADGDVFYGCTATGVISCDSPPPLKDFYGGLFCDEPGLGKTITCLALILRTKGIMPSVPEEIDGEDVTWLDTHNGKKLGFYNISRANAGSASEMEYRRKELTRASSSSAPMTRTRRSVTMGAHEALGEPRDSWHFAVHNNIQGVALPTKQRRQVIITPHDTTPFSDAGGMEVEDGLNTIPLESQQQQEEEEPDVPTPELKRQKRSWSNNNQGDNALFIEDSEEEDESSDEDKQTVDVVSPGVVDASMEPDDASRFFPAAKEENVEEYEYDTSSSSESDGDGQYWVQCCVCDKWRQLPPGFEAPLEDSWACIMHPIEGWRSCKIRSDEDDSSMVTAATGWVLAEEINTGNNSRLKASLDNAQQSTFEANVTFYRELLFKNISYSPINWDRLAARKLTAFAWLCLQKHDRLCRGVRISSVDAQPIGFGTAFLEIGLQPMQDKPKIKRNA